MKYNHSDADETAHDESKERIEFPIPKGFTPPESKDGRFDIVSTYQTKPDGKTLCLVQIGDTPLPGYDGKDESPKREQKPDYSEVTGPMVAAMGQGMGGNPGASGGY